MGKESPGGRSRLHVCPLQVQHSPICGTGGQAQPRLHPAGKIFKDVVWLGFFVALSHISWEERFPWGAAACRTPRSVRGTPRGAGKGPKPRFPVQPCDSQRSSPRLVRGIAVSMLAGGLMAANHCGYRFLPRLQTPLHCASARVCKPHSTVQVPECANPTPLCKCLSVQTPLQC